MQNRRLYGQTIIIALALLIFSANFLFATNKKPNQLVAKFSKKISIPEFLDFYNGYLIDSIPEANCYLIHFEDDEQLEGLLSKAPDGYNIDFLQPNYIWGIPQLEQMSQSFPDETEPVLLMGVSPISYFDQPDEIGVNLDSAHNIVTGEGITVAVIDNGISYSHPLFVDMLPGISYDFIENDNNPVEIEGITYGHGTFVAGIIKLIAPDCNILPIRAFNEQGLGTTFNIAKSVYFAIGQRVDVINMSFSSPDRDMILESAIRQAYISGISMVGASGNDGEDYRAYPASNSMVIGVGAIDSAEIRADFSNYGSWLDVSAPGVDVYSSLAGDFEWGNWSGTSFAAPMVSAACALVKEYEPGASPGYILNLIKKNSRSDMIWGNIPGGSNEYGAGCLDILETVLNAPRDFVSLSGLMMLEDEMSQIIFVLYQTDDDSVELLDNYDYDNSGTVNILDLIYLIENNKE